MLDDLDAETLKIRLLELSRELSELDQQGAEGRQTVALDQARVGRLSRMDALQGQAMSKAAQERRKLQYREVLRALQRLEDGCYGECTACDEPISLARLEASPEAALCINCANLAEQ